MTQYSTLTITKQANGSYVIAGDNPIDDNTAHLQIVYTIVPVGFSISSLTVGFDPSVSLPLAQQINWSISGNVITINDSDSVYGVIEIFFGFSDAATGLWYFFDPDVDNEKPPAP